MAIFALLFPFSNIHAGGPLYSNLSDKGVLQLQHVGTFLKKVCPPEDCLQVFIGRSGTIISAYQTANVGPTSILNLPVSGLSSKDFSQHLFTQHSAEIQQHFSNWVLDKFLKPRLEESPQISKIIVIDHMETGNTLALVSSWIHQYVKNRDPSKKVEAAGYGIVSSRSETLFQGSSIVLHNFLQFENRQTLKIGDLEWFNIYEHAQVHAPFGENVLRSIQQLIGETPPLLAIDENIRRHLPTGEKTASYRDLVGLFKAKKHPSEFPTYESVYCQSVIKKYGMTTHPELHVQTADN